MAGWRRWFVSPGGMTTGRRDWEDREGVAEVKSIRYISRLPVYFATRVMAFMYPDAAFSISIMDPLIKVKCK